jgi:hypothetical protein
VFLFRVGLALAICCRGLIVDCQSGDAALALLAELPAECLPDTAEAFISLAQSMKLSESDVLKQRGKMESQLRKQQTQQARPGRARGMSVGAKSISVKRG